jgi:hypothetical protein
MIRDALSSLDGIVILIRSLYAKPRLDDIVCQLTCRMLGTVVGHEAVNELVCSRLHKHSRKRTVKAQDGLAPYCIRCPQR